MLNYCAVVAASPDPEDPEATLRDIESVKDQSRVIDERLDPYSARFSPREPRTERLAAVVRMERQVEEIVRRRSWDVVRQRCGQRTETWQDAMEAWGNARPKGQGQ